MSKITTKPKFCSLQTLAHELDVNPRTIQRWMKLEVISYIKIRNVIRFNREKVMREINEFEIKADV